MAHLRKKQGSPFWFAVWRSGRQVVNRSTKETNIHKARDVMGQWKSEFDKSFHKKIGKITFKVLSERWIKQQEPNLKLQTTASYKEALKRVAPFIDSRIVRDIKPEHVEDLKTKLTESNRSARSVNYSLWVVRAVLDYAVKMGYSHTNAGKLVKGIKQHSKVRKSFSLDELHNLFNVLEGQDKLLVQLAALCGLRRGEIYGLKWSCIDFEKQTLEVRESYYGKKFGVDTPKTEGSIRTVLLPPMIVQSLKSHKLEQEQQRRWHKNGKWKNPDLVFTTPDGDYLPPRHAGDLILTPALERANLPHMRFHDLRGIAITLMLESGASLKHVMDQVGHKTPAMTLSVYSRVTKEAGKQAQQKLQDYVFPNILEQMKSA